MRTIIHDLDEKSLSKFNFGSDDKIIDALKCNNNCIGCFSCWIKHPKKCIHQDDYSNIVESLKQSDELIIITKCRYGCYSHKVKTVLERCIGYVLPYFTMRGGEIHHKPRYNKNIRIIVYAYGDISDEDKNCLSELVKANADNLNTNLFEINYINDLEEIENVHIN